VKGKRWRERRDRTSSTLLLRRGERVGKPAPKETEKNRAAEPSPFFSGIRVVGGKNTDRSARNHWQETCDQKTPNGTNAKKEGGKKNELKQASRRTVV